MRVRVPDYFDGFSCLAGACPHSCCIGWEVVLDEDTVRRYQQLPGSLGERLRDAMTLDGEDVCFPLDGHRCPFLNQENLGAGGPLRHLPGASPFYRGLRTLSGDHSVCRLSQGQ